ncbi:MAG: basic amino acid ABC transporter substrate-binding protein [Firmicutes bacterium]|nr:basic amino acid ABC transporter substrate-binding protein [Bacillota bacterium]
MIRRTRRLRSLSFALLAGLLLAAAGCGGQAPASGGAASSGTASSSSSSSGATGKSYLQVGTEAAYAPFESVDPATGKYVGFDMELIDAVAKAAGFAGAQIHNIKWDGLIPALNDHEVDAVISAMTITDDRAKSVTFSDPYFTAGQVIGVKQGSSIKTPDDLAGKKVGVQANTTGDYAAQKVKGAIVVRYPQTPDAINALLNGDVEAVVIDAPVLYNFIKENPDRGVVAAGEPFTVEYYGIAMRKGDTELAAKINQALAKVKADGTYQKLYDKYFAAK